MDMSGIRSGICTIYVGQKTDKISRFILINLYKFKLKINIIWALRVSTI